VAIDVGAGDGRAVLDLAARDPATLAIGLDPDARSMAEASRRAAARVERGGRPNALFVVASAEAAPVELRGLADLVTVRFPWAGLLRGCLGLEPRVAVGVASLLAPNGRLELLLAPAARDRLTGLPVEPAAVIAAAAAAFASSGLRLVEGREASPGEIRASGSTWARRLLAGGTAPDRRVTLVRFERGG
jgi:16S rRNA (adenine(1408)-N(1))-methyltransferase